LMSLLLDQKQRQRYIDEYRFGEGAKEAKREASGLEQLAAQTAAVSHRSRKVPTRSLRDTYRQLWVLVGRQIALLLTRALKDNERNGSQLFRNGVIVSLPLIIAIASAALAALVAGPP